MPHLILIPARKNSRRLPGKNMRLLGGKPLIQHSMEYALQHAGPSDKIIVSSDDEAILDLAGKMGIEAHHRPAELARDETPTAQVLQAIAVEFGNDFQDVILLQPTNPFRPRDLWKNALQIFYNSGRNSLMSVSPVKHKLGRIEKEKFMPFNYTFGQRSQDMEPLFRENGLFYITRMSYIRKGQIITPDVFPLITDHIYGTVDIDTREDWDWAEFVYRKYVQHEK